MRSPLGSLLNRSPVSHAPRSTSLILPGSTRGGVEQQLRSMGSLGTLFAIVTVLANNTSRIDWQLWRKAPSGNPEDRTLVASHAALDLWARPNPFMYRQRFVEASQQHLDLTGEAWWLIARNPMSPLPLELWPVRPDRMIPIPHPTEFIAGYVYMGPDGERVPLERGDVIQLMMPNPVDVYRGMGPVQSVLTDIDAARYSAEWNRNFFLNSAEPGGIIEVEQMLGPDEFEELRQRWAEQHRGVAAAHRVAIIEAGMKWVDRSLSQRDMQFVELRQVSRDVLREAFGMPKFAIGDLDDVNRATAEASATWFGASMLTPRAERIKGALNQRLMPLYGPGADMLEWDYVSPVPADRESDDASMTARATTVKLLIEAGFDPDEAREVAGLPEMAWIGAPEPEPVAAAPPGPPALVPSRRGAPAGRLHVEGRWSHQEPVLFDQGEDEDAAAREDWEDRVDELVRAWERDVTPDQIDELADQIEELVNAGKPGDLAELDVEDGQGAALLTDAMIGQAIAGAYRMAELAAEAGVSIAPVVPVEPPKDRAPMVRGAIPRPFKVLEGLAEDLGAAAKLTAKSLRGAFVSSAAREAMRVWSPAATGREVAQRVRTHLEGLTSATLRRELAGAVWAGENEGRSSTLEQAESDGSGATAYIADERRDRNTCKPCRAVDGERFSSLEDVQAAYPFGGYRKCEGGTQCRGTYYPVWE